jgi:S1-C subfamily serine protease
MTEPERLIAEFVTATNEHGLLKYPHFERLRGQMSTWIAERGASSLYNAYLAAEFFEFMNEPDAHGVPRAVAAPFDDSILNRMMSEVANSGVSLIAAYQVAMRASTHAQGIVSSSGSGFFVTDDGLVLTNAHVVEGCSTINVALAGGATSAARVIAADATNDFALLATGHTSCSFASFRLGVRTGESVAAYGFPHVGLLSSTGNFTRGDVTAVAGINNDTRMLQITAPIQPGNSGGPLLDQRCCIVGVVSSTLKAANLGSVPQNVNFAIKAAIAHSFLEANGVAVECVVGSPEGELLSAPELAEAAKEFTVLITCSR